MVQCELCDIKESCTSLTVFGDRGAERIALCAACQAKAKARDPETWDTIREILRGQ